jgi:hypothetical protein
VVRVPPRQLVLGFSRGWGDDKSVFILPTSVGAAFAKLPRRQQPRGLMYWEANSDGGMANGTYPGVSLNAGFNNILHVRNATAAAAAAGAAAAAAAAAAAGAAAVS